MKPKAVVAYSGGLDTTYCAVWLREQGYDVHTVTVNTGGLDSDALARIATRTRALGVVEHHTIDARRELFDDYLRFLIFGNVLRGDVYPLCVSAERIAQAKACAQEARRLGAAALAHGSTGAGNDQIRFDVAFGVVAPGLGILAPIRSLGLSREQEVAWLAQRGIAITADTATYSVNIGLWGATIGGAETHRGDGVLPEDAYVLTQPASRWPDQAEEIVIRFERGVPAALDGQTMDPVRLIELLNERAGAHGIGRGMHVGDTILGIKGRVAFEAPAATLLISAHRELEKLVLSRQQLTWKRTLGDLYGAMLHEAQYFDPIMRDLEAFLASSQRVVSGDVRVRMFRGVGTVLGASSPWSLLDQTEARYGETTSLWNGAEAAAFAKLYGLQQRCLAAVGEGGDAAVD